LKFLMKPTFKLLKKVAYEFGTSYVGRIIVAGFVWELQREVRWQIRKIIRSAIYKDEVYHQPRYYRTRRSYRRRYP